ncbi:MAG: LPS export ABC transporter periplasmic protein LptC [Flavobacteriaceae bacterium]|jgi:LPS export ABC transporter protein LptC
MTSFLLNLVKRVLVLTISLFISCVDNSAVLQEINRDRQDPLGIATNIRLVYTDSTNVQAILTAPKHLDFTNLSFRYAEFPEGLEVIFYDDKKNENILIADYGILYEETKLIDLRGNVQLKSYDGSILTTNQLFWDAQSEWIFTEKPFTFQDKDYNFDAQRLDANKDFTKFQTGNLIGTITVSEQKDSIIQP